MSSLEMSASARAASMAMLLDACAVEVVGAFERAGIQSVLLRGPVLAAWLYGDDEPRAYTDVDLLVSPTDIPAAEAILENLDFRLLPLPPHDQHARTWVREDGASVDLHRSLSGIETNPELVWTVLCRDLASLNVYGRNVTIPSRAVCAFEVALHVAQHGRHFEHPLEDLRRALERTEVAVWRAAAGLALELGAQSAFSAGLRRLSGGSELANRLGLPVEQSVTTVLRSGDPPSMALGLDWLLTRQGAVAKLRFAGSKIFPAPAFMRAWSNIANRGPLGLAASYLHRLAWVAWHAGPAVRAWRHARRDVRHQSGR